MAALILGWLVWVAEGGACFAIGYFLGREDVRL